MNNCFNKSGGNKKFLKAFVKKKKKLISTVKFEIHSSASEFSIKNKFIYMQ